MGLGSYTAGLTVYCVLIMLPLPTYQDVQRAAQHLAGVAHKTPVLTSTILNNLVDAQVFLKCENFQRMGAFKFRGAFNALSHFTAAQRQQGVVAFSSGNHAQAVALGARLLDMPATIVMPQDAPAVKIAATRGYGASIVLYNRFTEDREAIGRKIAEEYGRTLVPPFDAPDVIAGQGTAAKELFEQAGELDALFVCLGGGGLLAGSALAATALSPACRLYGVEPAAGNDGQQSFRTGTRVKIETPNTIADGAQTQQLGVYTFPIIQRLVSDVFTATDEQLVQAMLFVAQHLKMIIEPTGALGFAAMLEAVKHPAYALKGKRIGVLISGGNVDMQQFCTLVRQHAAIGQ
jgi:threo-3-hydroxy-L-aspartate ammonia-lyase